MKPTTSFAPYCLIKSLKKTLPIVLLLPIGLTHAATIEVTTLVDEDGTGENCSLREAIQASIRKQEYGGCEAGQRNIKDVIQLEAGTYQLSRAIKIDPNEIKANDFNGIKIRGKTPVDLSQLKVYNFGEENIDVYGKQLLPSTLIKAAPNQRIFNTAQERAKLELYNMQLLGNGLLDISQPELNKGGLINAGSNLTLDYVFLKDGKANQGGAIYLSGVNANLTAKHSLFRGNDSLRVSNRQGDGAVVAMSCFDNLDYTSRSINIDNSSIVENGSSTTQSLIQTCGLPKLEIVGTTIANNKAQNQIINFLNNNDSLNDGAKLVLSHTTVVNNVAPAVIRYGDTGNISLYASILAFNQGKDCVYESDTDLDRLPHTRLKASKSLLEGQNTNRSKNSCQLPDLASKDLNNIYINNVTLSNYLYPLSDYGKGILSYLPKSNDSLEVQSSASYICSGIDPRGVPRAIAQLTTRSRRCYVGALQKSNLIAKHDTNLTNQNYQQVIEQIESRIENLEESIENKRDIWSPEEVKYFKLNLKKDKAYLSRYQQVAKYRQVVSDILGDDLPREVFGSTNQQPSSTFRKFPLLIDQDAQGNYIQAYEDNYTIQLLPLGTDIDIFDRNYRNDNIQELINNIVPNDNISCQWDNKLQRAILSRKDNLPTPSGSFEYCKYIVTDTASGDTTTGYIQFSIRNLAPIAEPDEYILPYGAGSIKLDLLANDSDAGDGPKLPNSVTPFFETYQKDKDGKLVTDATGKPVIDANSVNIRIVDKPSLGKLKFERAGLCPDNTATTEQQTCYGGELTYISNNAYSPFSDSFSYQVLDSSKAVSNVAEVEIINTKADQEGQSTPILEGGGSTHPWMIFGLLSLLLARLSLSKKALTKT